MSYQQGPQYGYSPQQPGYPPQQGYPQQPGGYPPPGYPQPPRKKNTALIVTLSGVAAAAVIALVLVLVLSGKDDSSANSGTSNPSNANAGNGLPGAGGLPGGGKAGGSPKTGSSGGSGSSSGGGAGSARELAETAVAIINSHSTSQISGLTCDTNATRELTGAMGQLPASATATLGDVQESGTYAAASIKILMGSQTKNITLSMAQKGSKWCAAGL